ncbi:S10 family serine carboxypeptidase-like protein [Sphingopyxis panaciterrae]
MRKICETGSAKRGGRWLASLALVAAAVGSAQTGLAADALEGRMFDRIEPLTQGDEAIVVRRNRIQTASGALDYEVRTGRLAIRTDRTGEIRGHIFFVAYVAKSKGAPRPLTFAWNGGPLIPAAIVHMEGLAPRRRTAGGMVDNPETLLADSDLVFMDPVETGFSRPAKPEFASDFMNMRGDVNATAEFIRAYRMQFRAVEQPIFLLGESYGVFRAAALADLMTQRGDPLAGTIFISGDIPNIPQSPAFYDAMHVPARVAAAFHYKRLEPALMRDRDATIREAQDWSRTVYLPALERLGQLTHEEREKIAADLARYIGLRPEQVDRKSLVVHAGQYLSSFLGDDGTRPLGEEDMRQIEGEPGTELSDPKLLDHYLRSELGYATALTYAGVEAGYVPFPGPKLLTIRDQWQYNQPGITPEVLAEMQRTGEVSPLARANPPWIVDALKRDPKLRVYVATGRFDPLNMCEGNVLATATLPAEMGSRISNTCYESGHIIFRDESARPQILRDLRAFIRGRMKKD